MQHYYHYINKEIKLIPITNKFYYQHLIGAIVAKSSESFVGVLHLVSTIDSSTRVQLSIIIFNSKGSFT